MTISTFFIFIAAAALEVGGDALIFRGLRGRGVVLVCSGCVALACYGLVVNVVRWDFSKLLGVYIAVFACFSVGTARFVLEEAIPFSTWAGVGLIVLGGIIIQYGSKTL